MKILTILRRARKLLSKPERWGKGQFAVTADGLVCDALGRNATKFCMIGAIVRANKRDDKNSDDAIDLLEFLRQQKLSAWNDAPRRTHAQVLRLLDRGIARAETGGR